MKLAIHKRTTGKKGEINQLRRTGNVPAVLYGQREAGMPIFIKGEEIQAILRNIQPGLLATTVFEVEVEGKKRKALVKDMQYHVTSYDLLHLDLVLLDDQMPITVNVPIRLVGAAECAGVKLGGFVRQPIRSMAVSCLPKDIPQEFVVDVKELNIGQSKRLSEISLPQGVRPLAKLDEVAVIVGKKAGT